MIVETGDIRWRRINDNSFRLCLNEQLFIENAPELTRSFRIGGYPVIDKWLDYREGYNLRVDDIEHLQHLIASLNATADVISEIDRLIADTLA